VHYKHNATASITLCSKATSTPMLPSLDADEVHVVAWSGQTCLAIMSSRSGAAFSIDVDLQLADVKNDWDSDSEQHVIIVNPWCEPQHKNFEFSAISYETLSRRSNVAAIGDEAWSIPNECQDEHSEDGYVAPEFWIFVVEGDDSAVRTILWRMGEAGAIRQNPLAVLQVGEKIGSGANAVVYHAQHRHAPANSEMVLKVLNAKPNCATALEELDLVQHEITLMVHAGRHPNIAKFQGIFSIEGESKSIDINMLPCSFEPSGLKPRWALVSEYLRGGDVFDAVAKRRFKEKCAHQVMADLLSALTHIHRRGIVHRDVKAENLLLTTDGKAVLTDFGQAALISDDEAMCKCCGSPGYAAPEILGKMRYGFKVDSFSAGVTLYFMISCKLPFEGRDVNSVLRRTLKREVSFDNRPEFSKVSKQCKLFICKLLEKNPHNRPTAEQAASQMWCFSGNDMRCEQQTWTSNSVGGRPFMDVDAVSKMPEASFCDRFMPFDHHDQGASSFHNCLGLKMDKRHAKEDDVGNRFDSVSTRDTDGQRGSFRGWSKKVSSLVPRLRTSKSDSHCSHSSNMDRESCDSERSIISPVDEADLVTQVPSNTSGRHNSHTQSGRPLLKAPNSGAQAGTHDSGLLPTGDFKVVPPAWRPEHSRSKSLWGRISRGLNRREAPLHKEVDDANDSRASASSLGPVIKNDELGAVFCPTGEGQQSSPSQALLPPKLPGWCHDANDGVASFSSLNPGIKHDGSGGFFIPFDEGCQPGPPKALPPPTSPGRYDDGDDVDDDGDHNDDEKRSVASSSSLDPGIKHDGLGASLSHIDKFRQPSPPKTLPPPTQPRARYRNLNKEKATSVASQAQDACTEK